MDVRALGSGCGFDGDAVSEGLELSDVVALLGFGVDRSGVVIRPEVDVVGIGVGQQVPDDDEHRASDCDLCPLLAAASGDAAIALAEEGVGASCGDRGFAEDPGQVAVAVSG